MQGKLLLIDGHSILSRAFYGIPMLTSSRGIHTNAVYGFLNILFKVIDEEQADHLAVAFDLSRHTFRTELFSGYKGTRKEMPEELREQVPIIQEILKAMNIPILTMEQYEADDILGTIAKRSQKEGISVTVLSGDRDLLHDLAGSENVTDILYDMKSIDNDIHKEYTGRSNELIIENLMMLAQDPRTNPKIQMRMPLVKGVNDGWDIIEKTAEFYKEHAIRRVTLLPYHNLGVSKMRNIGGEPVEFEPPSDEYVEKIKEYFEDEAGMTVEILGKVK